MNACMKGSGAYSNRFVLDG